MKFKANKNSFAYKLQREIYKAAVEVAGKRAIKPADVILEHPSQFDHGDYATNIAMRIKTDKYPTPWDLANEITNAWRTTGLPEWVAKVEVVKPGFINLWLKNEALSERLVEVLKKKDKYGQGIGLKNQKFLLEHTSPNPQTTIMLGHLRNNFLGMTAANLLEFLGAKVTKDCIVNDRGIHLCRSVWGYLVFGRKKSGLRKSQLKNFRKIPGGQIKKIAKESNWQEFLNGWLKKKSAWWQPQDLDLKPDHANLIWYVLGSRAYCLSEKVQKQVKAILVAWENEDLKIPRRQRKVWPVWEKILDWSAKGYVDTYQRVGSKHDYVWYEHKLYKGGKELVAKGLKKGVFKKSQGAIVTDLNKYGIPDTVLIKSDGAAVYHTFDIYFTQQKRKKFPSALYIWDIGSEQTLYFKQLFAICEQLGIGKKEDYFHLAYALINFKGKGKMATRTGDVVMADKVLDELKKRALEVIKASNQELRGKLSAKQLDDLAEKVALAAIKYSFLKFARMTTIQYDIDESLNLEGNSGPYLQYTHARCRSVLAKGERVKEHESKNGEKILTFLLSGSLALNPEETVLLRTIYKFPEVVVEAAKGFAPNLVCNFLFDLAQKYNLFYNKHPILRAGAPELINFRLALTAAVAQVLKNGLTLLGIETPERM